MHGPDIVARTMSRAAKTGKSGEWQYHSRSDRHSKVACWGIVFDLLHRCPAIAEHARSGALAFGINHEMRDFKSDRKKDLDLVLCTRRDAHAIHHDISWKQLGPDYGVVLTNEEDAILETLPDMMRAPVGTVRVALEAKACMTAHIKALPRFFDELNSSHATIHGNSDAAIAVGLALVNSASTFVSPGMNTGDGKRERVSKHKQPGDTIRVIEKVKQIPRRTQANEAGYDAFGVTVVDCRNDGSPVTLVSDPPAPPRGDILHYASMIDRACQAYTYRFART